MLSPLASTASDDTKEAWFLFYSVEENGAVIIEGMSVDMLDDATPVQAAVDPFDPIKIGEEKCITSMSLHQYNSLIPAEELHGPLQGILTSSMSHNGISMRGGKNSSEEARTLAPHHDQRIIGRGKCHGAAAHREEFSGEQEESQHEEFHEQQNLGLQEEELGRTDASLQYAEYAGEQETEPATDWEGFQQIEDTAIRRSRGPSVADESGRRP